MLLERRDTLHIIVDIGVEPRQYSELAERVSIEENSLSKRLTTGIKLHVCRKDIVETADGNKRVYRLDRNGEVAFEQLDEMDAMEVSQQAQDNLAVAEEARRTLVGRLRDRSRAAQ